MRFPFFPNQAGRAPARSMTRTAARMASASAVTLAATLVLALALALRPAPARAAALSVTVTVAPQRWLVDQIGGGLVSTQVLVPAGADPHTYEPKPSQLATLAGSQLYLTIGLPVEQAWGKRLQGVNPDLVVTPMDQGLERIPMAAELPMPGAPDADHHPEGDGDHHPGPPPGGPDGAPHPDHQPGPPPEGEHHHHEHGGLDPHVWTSPANMLRMAATVRDALTAQDPAHKAEYAAGYEAATGRITALDGELRTLFASLPQDKRQFIVYHPAWGYFARDYGLTQVPVEMEGKEPGPRALAGLIDYARAHRITTIFVQPQFSEKSAKTLAEAIGGAVVPADPLAVDWEANIRSVAGAFRASMNIETP